jgi:hypothetical protein
MGLETATYIDELVPSNPLSTDAVRQGDDHLRLIKQVLQNTFPDAGSPIRKWRTEAVNSNTTATAADDATLYLVDASGGARTITLPAASTAGVLIGVKKIDASANTVTIDPNSSEVIDGATTRVIANRYTTVWAISDGTAWQITMLAEGASNTRAELTRARVATVANVNLASGLVSGTTIDGVAVAAGDTVLVMGQTSASQNGLYTVPASGAASRTPSFATWNSLVGLTVNVVEGTEQGGSVWHNLAAFAGTLGTNNIVFSKILTIGDFSSIEPDLSRDDYLLGVNGATGKTVLVDVGDLPGVRQIHVRELRPSGSNAITVPTGLSNRVLNNTVSNSITGASLASNQITLPSGTYDINALTPFVLDGGRAQGTLYNVTDSSTTIVGTSVYARDANDATMHSFILGRFSITSQKVFSIRVYSSVNASGGNYSGGGFGEVYTDVIITKVE